MYAAEITMKTPELAKMILENLEEGDARALMHVCRNWFELLGPNGWKIAKGTDSLRILVRMRHAWGTLSDGVFIASPPLRRFL